MDGPRQRVWPMNRLPKCIPLSGRRTPEGSSNQTVRMTVDEAVRETYSLAFRYGESESFCKVANHIFVGKVRQTNWKFAPSIRATCWAARNGTFKAIKAILILPFIWRWQSMQIFGKINKWPLGFHDFKLSFRKCCYRWSLVLHPNGIPET